MEWKNKAFYVAVTMISMISAASASTVNLSALWDFIDEITTHQAEVIALIIFFVVIFIVKKFGKGLGDALGTMSDKLSK